MIMITDETFTKDTEMYLISFNNMLLSYSRPPCETFTPPQFKHPDSRENREIF